jgi:hypothetical protein
MLAFLCQRLSACLFVRSFPFPCPRLFLRRSARFLFRRPSPRFFSCLLRSPLLLLGALTLLSPRLFLLLRLALSAPWVTRLCGWRLILRSLP